MRILRSPRIRMKPLYLFLAMLLVPTIWAKPEGEIFRIQIEWLNAKECGIEGCKPQSFILRDGGSVGSMWSGLPERGLFNVRLALVEKGAKVAVKRTRPGKENSPDVIESFESTFDLGSPKEVSIGELRWMVTVTLEPSP